MHKGKSAVNAIIFVARHELEGKELKGPIGTPVNNLQAIQDLLQGEASTNVSTLIDVSDTSQSWPANSKSYRYGSNCTLVYTHCRTFGKLDRSRRGRSCMLGW
jgi:hypothetical protein